MAQDRVGLLEEVTTSSLDDIIANHPDYTPHQVADKILEDIKTTFDLENAIKGRGKKFGIPDALIPQQVGMIIARMRPVRLIVTTNAGSDSDYALLGVYQEDGPNQGIYDTSDEAVRNLVREYNFSLSKNQIEEAASFLRDNIPRVSPCKEKNLIAVNNGIFDFDTKKLLPFSDDKVFLSKSKVNYNPNAKNITIHNDADGTDWDVESWMNSLSDDPEVVNVLWQIIGAIIRPNVPWGKSAWFYAESGNNGKGTLCELMRQICGEGTYASIPLSDMGKDFMLEPLTHASAIIVDENDVGTYIDKAANLKAIITGDTIQINRKFKTPVPHKFHGFMVQCMNEMPKIKDKSDSFFRRQLFVPFTKCFTGVERKYIKQDYLKRKEVLEYVLFKVLNMDYEELSVPKVCEDALNEYKEFNDPVRQFLSEVLKKAKWSLLPYEFLYDMYKVWFKNNIPNGTVQGRAAFIKDVKAIVNNDTSLGWSDSQARVATHMICAEPLIREYELFKWGNARYATSKNDENACVYVLPDNDKDKKFRGLKKLDKQNGLFCDGDTEENAGEE